MGSLENRPGILGGIAICPTRLRKIYALLAMSFSFVWLASDGSTNLLQKLLTAVFLFLVFKNKELRREPVVLGSLLLIVFFSLEFAWHFFSIPEDIFAGRFPTKYISFFCFFILIAYGTVIWEKISPFLILVGAAVGLLAFLLFHSSIEEWQLSWQGARVDFGFRNAQHAGVFFGTGLLGISFLGHRLVRSSLRSARMLGVLGVLAFAALMIYGVVATQVRAVWMGLIMASFLIGMVYLFSADLKSLISWFKQLKHIVLTLLIIAFLSTVASALDIQDRMLHRVGQERISMQTVQEASQFEEKELKSSGIRIALWTASLRWIHERPLLGWGSNSVSQLIRADSRFNAQFKQSFGHLHNSKLEILVAVGIVGLCGIGGVFILLIKSVLSARRTKAMPKDAFLFALAFLVFWLTVNCFESYVNYSTGFYINTIVASFLYSFYIQRSSHSLNASSCL
jgi:O-antigen ligase